MNNLYKTLNSQNTKLNLIQFYTKRFNSQTSAEKKVSIKIPNRIERGPTDILRALSSTIGSDSTAAHYKYHDDPFLIPTSNVGKRTFAMSQEAGRKAAKWIRQENSKLFQHTVADPPIKVFYPQVIYTEESVVDIKSLEDCINNIQLSDAIFVYNLLKGKGIEIPNELKLKLLEFISFYNNEEPLPDDLIEERWFRQSTSGKERQRKSWKDGDLAEQLFNEIELKDARLYSTLIRGMAKYYQIEKAWALFQEALDKNLQLDVNTYNAILQNVFFIKESSEMRWEQTQEILQLMVKNQIKPNLETFNSILFTISTIGINKLARNYALKTLAEMKFLNITPSLGSWYYILIIFCRERGPVSHVLIDILKEIEGKEFTIHDIKDTFFFVTAMDVCRNHLHDKELAKRVNDLLHFGHNYDLIGDSYKESIYYRHYLTLLCQSEPLDKFMNETYNLLVPNIYIPEPGVMEEILKSIDTNGELPYIPKIWSDMIIFEHTNRLNLLERILKIMIDNPPDVTITNQMELNEKFKNIAWDTWNLIENQPENRTQKLSWTGELLGNILQLCARDNDIEKSNVIFEKLDKNQHKIVGTPSSKSLEAYIQQCILEKLPTKAISCLQYCSENVIADTENFGKLIIAKFTLNEGQIDKVNSLIGRSV